MSTQLCIQGYSVSGPDGLKTSEVLNLFGIADSHHVAECVHLAYDETDSCDLNIKEENGKAVAIIISRPCKHERLWMDVFTVLMRGPYVAYMPDSPAPLLVNTTVGDHMPANMKDALGTPIRVSSAAELSSKIIGM